LPVAPILKRLRRRGVVAVHVDDHLALLLGWRQVRLIFCIAASSRFFKLSISTRAARGHFFVRTGNFRN
jgi:hypothetical protein